MRVPGFSLNPVPEAVLGVRIDSLDILMVGMSLGVLTPSDEVLFKPVRDAPSPASPFMSTETFVLCRRYSSSMTKTEDLILRSSSQPILETRRVRREYALANVPRRLGAGRRRRAISACQLDQRKSWKNGRKVAAHLIFS